MEPRNTPKTRLKPLPKTVTANSPHTDDTSHGWHDWDVAGLSCSVYQPHNVNEHGFTLIYLHDQDERGLTGRTQYESQFEAHGFRVIVPHCGRCWWSDRDTSRFQHHGATAEHFVTQTLLAAIQDRFDIQPPQLGLFGIGMGGQGALRTSYRHPNKFPVVVGVAADLDFHTRIKQGDEVLFEMYGDTESARQDTPILHIHPLNWPRHQFFCANPDDSRTFESADRLRMKMSSIGIMFECDIETKPAKGINYADHMAEKAIGFLAERLNKERLRIV